MLRPLLLAFLLGNLAVAAPVAAPDHAAPPAPPPPPDSAAEARLAGGEVLLSSHPVGPRALAEEIGRGVIDAPPARVFAALIDFAHYQEWVPFVKHSDAHRETDGSVISFQSLDLPFPAGNRHYKIHAWSMAAREDTAVSAGAGAGAGGASSGREEAQTAAPAEPTWRVWWTYVPQSGNVADHYGWWVLQPFGAGRTLGTCLLYTDPGSLPAWALHMGTSQTMPYIFSGLRQQIHRSRYDHP
jgi:hypothetical protein